MPDLKLILNRVAAGEVMTREASQELFDFMVSGAATGPQIGALLMGLRMRGETHQEIVGAVEAMRRRMVRVSAPDGAVDIVGTGGDGAGTFNISTAASFIVAGAGVPVAKHGNRAVSSKSGAADVLRALGVAVDQPPVGVERCLHKAGMGFMFAPSHHPALQTVMSARVEMGVRTIFNILGPLLNPASVTHHLIGVYSRDLLLPMAHALRDLGSTRGLVVHGADGLDEITTTGVTHVAMLSEGRIRTFDLVPEDVGVPRSSLASLKGGDGHSNASALQALLRGEGGPYRDIALLNAAGALIAAGVSETWVEGIERARKSIDGGYAASVLRRLVQVSNEALEAVPA
ncbi:anthranilate phosphoribosyltransferase [Aureimonas ureilytica]|uniref:Anthranilate phosphoribosyltransferase n=1 Tax=Aureimonas ureilytica TaxID=401562 RepID=A0A175RGP6_9HYPH|nr:anthranilate phosphoribosyltransferase [Aureimonas ureilytica]KTR02521.1 anthranilate phosphoribosyltransferase [Aureimonas ureilytica]